MDFLWTTGAFLITIGVLVAIHEYGHFWCARRCGVHVVRFSIGFGPVIWSWRDRLGTEYAVSAIPLGGYVMMHGEAVPNEEADHLRAVSADKQSFAAKHPLAKIAITMAGPIANFLLAIILFWAVYLMGETSVKPVVGKPVVASIADKAALPEGVVITRVGSKNVLTWQDLSLALASHIGEARVSLTVQNPLNPSDVRDIQLDISDWTLNESEPDILHSLGISFWQPFIPARIGKVLEDGAAALSGLEDGDQIISIDGKPVSQWSDVSAAIMTQLDQSVTIVVQRGAVQKSIVVQTRTEERNNQKIAVIGIAPEPYMIPDAYKQTVEYAFLPALSKAAQKTWDLTLLSGQMLIKLITGDLSFKSLSGPLSIAQGAGETAKYGAVAFLTYLAFISINLGFINLLPIPLLDGGATVLHFVEWVRKRPLSENTQIIFQRIGFVIVGLLMMVAIMNDAIRISG